MRVSLRFAHREKRVHLFDKLGFVVKIIAGLSFFHEVVQHFVAAAEHGQTAGERLDVREALRFRQRGGHEPVKRDIVIRNVIPRNFADKMYPVLGVARFGDGLEIFFVRTRSDHDKMQLFVARGGYRPDWHLERLFLGQPADKNKNVVVGL